MNPKYTDRTDALVESFKRWADEQSYSLNIAVRLFQDGEDGRAANVLKNIAFELMTKMIVLSKAHGIAFQRLLEDTEYKDKDE